MVKDYTVLDLETTGLSKHRHEIIEIAAIRYKDGKKHSEFHTLVKPENKIPRFITNLTGIDDQLVKNAPKIHYVLPKLKLFLEKSTIVAHNATFDYGFLSKNFKRHLKHDFNNSKICTRKLANRLLPYLPSKKLSSLCSYYNIINEEEHRAMTDTKATVTLFNNFLEKLNDYKISGNDIIKFENWPVKKCKKMLEDV